MRLDGRMALEREGTGRTGLRAQKEHGKERGHKKEKKKRGIVRETFDMIGYVTQQLVVPSQAPTRRRECFFFVSRSERAGTEGRIGL